MKKTQKILSRIIIPSILIATLPMTKVSAETSVKQDNHIYSILVTSQSIEELMENDGQTVATKYEDEYRKGFTTLDKTGAHYYEEYNRRLVVAVSDDTELPIEEINEKLKNKNNKLYKISDMENTYQISISSYTDTDKQDVIDILFGYDNIKSITECSTVAITKQATFMRAYFTDELSAEELTKKFEKFNLEISPEEKVIHGKTYSYVGYPKENPVSNLKNEEYFNELLEFFRSEHVEFICPTDVSESRELSSIVYTPKTTDKTIGDLNNDNIIDLNDLSFLSLAILGDTELTSEQSSLADIDGNDTVNISDLARLKQYISNKITSIG
ncbi:MAG: hypothetical protein E7505_01580 [Ruminococcus sp.]|nr:hypothetical protein [Ruminococcus sp.]